MVVAGWKGRMDTSAHRHGLTADLDLDKIPEYLSAGADGRLSPRRPLHVAVAITNPRWRSVCFF